MKKHPLFQYVKKTTSALAVVSLFALPSSMAVAAPNPPSEQAISQLTQEVSSEILSPFCPGKTLAMCPSPAAADARRTIQKLAAQGLTKDQIKDELIDQYGPEFRRITPGLDDNLVVLVLVVIGLILCSAFVYYLAHKGDKKGGDPTDDTELTPDNNVVGATNMEKIEDDYLDGLRQEYKS